MSTDPPAPRFVLGMFPYPSGAPHLGHVRVYGITDAVARHARLHGHPVLHPLGWDAFGLPAENAARRRGLDPAAWTTANIEGMRASFTAMGWAFDADHEIDTSSAEYMRWTQWLFLQLLRRGLAVRQPAWVAWCDACATVLADEQVSDGTCWRCDGPVRRDQRVGWSFRITDYAQELWDGLDTLQGWDAEAVAVQRHWIGRSQGVRVRFASPRGPIETYTTRVDTLPGVVAIVLAPEHPAVDRSDPVVDAYVRKASGRTDVERLADRERSGVPAGFDTTHPLTGERVAVWVADYVIAGHGTGAVMCVPAHDRRDHAFATQVGLPVPVVVEPLDGAVPEGPFTGDGRMTAASGTFAGLQSEDARRAITAELEASGAGDRSTVFRLRDWSVGRQRRWGCPIPVVHCPTCGVVPVPDGELPVAVDAEPDVACPACGVAARRESDTLDTFVDSAWYAFRFTDPHATSAPFSREAAD